LNVLILLLLGLEFLESVNAGLKFCIKERTRPRKLADLVHQKEAVEGRNQIEVFDSYLRDFEVFFGSRSWSLLK
jgi:hypothetical protein